MSNLISFFEDGLMNFVSSVGNQLGEIGTTIKGLFTFLPVDLSACLIAILGFMIVLAIKRAVI